MKDVETKSKPNKKANSKVLSKQKHRQRRMLALYRIFKNGFSSFLRNSWLSIAATIVMTLTLLIIFISFSLQTIMNDTISDLRKKVDMSIYLRADTPDEVGLKLVDQLEDLSSVQSARYISSEDARQQIIDNSDGDTNTIEAIKEATNMTPATLRVVLKDINNTSQLEKFVKTNDLIKQYISADFKPSFAGTRRTTIKSIGRAVDFIQKISIGAGILFVIISSLIIFNTIRMAIFNRKEEIQMMKLIGADKSFIRGPFLVESVIYGAIAALFATGLGFWILLGSSATLKSYQIAVEPTTNLLVGYIWIVIPGMILVGAIIGITSSLLATHKYLKI